MTLSVRFGFWSDLIRIAMEYKITDVSFVVFPFLGWHRHEPGDHIILGDYLYPRADREYQISCFHALRRDATDFFMAGHDCIT